MREKRPSAAGLTTRLSMLKPRRENTSETRTSTPGLLFTNSEIVWKAGAGPGIAGRRPSFGRPSQVLPVGFSSRRLGFSINISLIAAPAGIIGNTLSSFTTSATTTHGPSS